MKQDFRILFLEDSLVDFELVLDEIKKEFSDLIYTNVTNRTDFERELETFKPDLVISDYMSPTPLVAENKSIMEWFPKDELLNWSTTYYWKVDVRDKTIM